MSARAVSKTLTLAGAGALLAVVVVVVVGATRYGRARDARAPAAAGFTLIGYHDLGGKPGFKMAMQMVENRWYLYVAHMWQPGWTVLDVTNPSQPEEKSFVPGPPNTMTLQVQVADGLMVTGLEAPQLDLLADLPWEGKAWIVWDGIRTGKYTPWRSSQDGLWLWDVHDPIRPTRIGAWRTGASGTHRNFYDGGRYIHVAATMPGFRGHIYVALDIADPAHPIEASRWFLPEQEISSGIRPERPGYYLHGPAHVEGQRAYLPYGVGGMIILDIADIHHPTLVGRLILPPDHGSAIGVHTVIPIPKRKIAVINSEPLAERCRDAGKNYAAVVDIADETVPRILSFFPELQPPPGSGSTSFCEDGGRFGPHNQHHQQHQPYLFASDTLIFMTYFNAGLRLYDIADAAHPREVGHFIPSDPTVRRGILPVDLVTQTEDVIVDARGYAYLSDKNQGIHIVRATDPATSSR